MGSTVGAGLPGSAPHTTTIEAALMHFDLTAVRLYLNILVTGNHHRRRGA